MDLAWQAGIPPHFATRLEFLIKAIAAIVNEISSK
jgi:hypothetical protein